MQWSNWSPVIQLPTGLILGGIAGYLGWKTKALDPSGAFAAALTGGFIFGLGGLRWAALLLVFFISSSLLSHLTNPYKNTLNEKFAKGSQRDWAQVLANGGAGIALVVFERYFPQTLLPWLAYAGALAAVTSDTWATELGTFSRHAPKLITSGKQVERGTSGGVTTLGYLAATSGAGLIGGTAIIFSPPGNLLAMLAAITLAGLAGTTLDSWLGATVQGIYYCRRCNKTTEQTPYHSCGNHVQAYRGWQWLNNDWVNAISSITGALAAVLFWLWVV